MTTKARHLQITFFFLSFLFLRPAFTSPYDWKKFKETTAEKTTHISGWCSKEKAHFIMDLIYENPFEVCVEVGVFMGASSFPIAKTLEFKNKGKLYAIDAWNSKVSVENLSPHDQNYIWWRQLNMNDAFLSFNQLLAQENLFQYCTPIKKHSFSAVGQFSNESIDFIHFDSNHEEETFYKEVIQYFPKVKNGGYLLITDCNWACMRKGMVFLLERTIIQSPYSENSIFLLLQKDPKKISNVKELCYENL